ncbi:MAG TPA: hypothetical protein VK168_12730 [Saprospiraceae bacterium]|nr:hypothetical protein [Saprospiraceae bacterium]
MQTLHFDIKILDLHWIKDVDDPTDLCAHGHVLVKIGNEIIADKDSLDVTLSATALHLMRTLKENYKKGDYSCQLLPCCGHFIMADEHKGIANIIGCPNGIDWTIIHTKDNKVKHISERGNEAIIDKEQYAKLVWAFADQVENFYKTSKPKILPTDDVEKRGYLSFWNEWRTLRGGLV